MMGSWFKKHWVTLTAVAIALLLGAGIWMYQMMFDLSSIQASNRCQCEGYILEHNIALAESIYRGSVTKISKSIKGDYTVTIQPEATLKGNPVTASQLKVSVSGNCPYPFQKHQSYIFILPDSVDSSSAAQSTASGAAQSAAQHVAQPISQCNTIISTADIDMMNTISQWLNVEVGRGQSGEGADPSGADSSSSNKSNHDGAARMFTAISAYESSIRIEEEGFKTWLYDGEDQLFFYSPDVKISLFIPLDRQVSQEEYDEFVNRITIESAVTGRRVAYVLGDVNIDVHELPIVLKLFNAPQEDLLIRFQSPDNEQSFTLPVQYTEPFTFKVSSTTDPNIDDYFATLQEGYYATNYVTNGQTHEYTIQFNQPVDRSSVYDKLYANLRYSMSSWSLRWINDYEVRLAFDFEANDAITFSLHGISNEAGYRLMSRELFTIQAAELSVFAAVDLEGNTRETYFTSIIPFSTIDVSPDGRLVLTGVEAHYGSSTVYRYDMRDRFGNVKKSFALGRVVDPSWINGEIPSLIYASGDQIIRFEPDSDETTTLWQLPAELTDGKLVSLDYSEQEGKLAAGAIHISRDGEPSYDLFIFDGIHDQSPLRIENFGAYECLEGDCATPNIQFTASNGILYTSWERAGEHVEGYISVLVHLDLETLDTRTVRPTGGGDSNDTELYPLQDGRVLQVASLSSAAEGATDDEGERWSIYDPVSHNIQVLVETYIGLFQHGWLEQAVPLNSGQILLQVYNRGWYLLDLNRARLSPFIEFQEEVYVIDVEANRIWFMESGVGS